MQHYVDLRLAPDANLTRQQLMSALYAKLHRALLTHQTGQVAVTFPGYSREELTLGDTVRLIGSESDMGELGAMDWLGGMRDHVQLGQLTAVPPGIAHRTLRRVQAKSSAQRLQRRQMRRHELTAEQARQRVPDSAAERLQLPFVALWSASTGQPFRLFLALSPQTAVSVAGIFNTYGLSSTATTPWF